MSTKKSTRTRFIASDSQDMPDATNQTEVNTYVMINMALLIQRFNSLTCIKNENYLDDVWGNLSMYKKEQGVLQTQVNDNKHDIKALNRLVWWCMGILSVVFITAIISVVLVV